MSRQNPAASEILISEEFRQRLDAVATGISLDIAARINDLAEVTESLRILDSLAEISRPQHAQLITSLSLEIVNKHEADLAALAASAQLSGADLFKSMKTLLDGYLNNDARAFAEHVLEQEADVTDQKNIDTWRGVIAENPLLYLIAIFLLMNAMAPQFRASAYTALIWNSLADSLIALSEVIEAQQHEHLSHEIEAILADATPEKLIPGTMNADRFASVMETMREGLSDSELDEIVQAMNEEYIKAADEPA